MKTNLHKSTIQDIWFWHNQAASIYADIFEKYHISQSEDWDLLSPKAKDDCLSALEQCFCNSKGLNQFYPGCGLITGQYMGAGQLDLFLPAYYTKPSRELNQCKQVVIQTGLEILENALQRGNYLQVDYVQKALLANTMPNQHQILIELNQLILKLYASDPNIALTGQQSSFLRNAMIPIIKHLRNKDYNTPKFVQLVIKVDQTLTHCCPLAYEFDHELLLLYAKKHPDCKICRETIAKDAKAAELAADKVPLYQGESMPIYAMSESGYDTAKHFYHMLNQSNDATRMTKKLRRIHALIPSAPDALIVDQTVPQPLDVLTQRDLWILSTKRTASSKPADIRRLQRLLLCMIANRIVIDQQTLNGATRLDDYFRQFNINSNYDAVFNAQNPENHESLHVSNYLQSIYQSAFSYYELAWAAEEQSFDFYQLFCASKLSPLVMHNFVLGFSLFFNQYDYDNAMVVLSSNLEYWFRSLSGATSTTKVMPDNSTEYNSLSHTLESPAMRNYLGSYLWIFDQLLLKEPMNIRNKAAHGLKDINPMAAWYFMGCLLKFLSDKQLIEFDI